jgi:hypothetical protein
MPYTVTKGSKGYVVKRSDTGKTVAGNKTPLSKERAVKAMKARYAHEND